MLLDAERCRQVLSSYHGDAMYGIASIRSMTHARRSRNKLTKRQPLFAVVQITQSPSAGLALGGIVQGSEIPSWAGTERPLSSLPSRPTLYTSGWPFTIL